MDEITPEQEVALEEVYALERQAYRHECADDIETSLHLRRQALRLEEQILGSQKDYFATSLSSLAIDLYKAKQYDEAEALFWRSLAIYKDISGPESLDVADELYWLASVYDDRKQYVKTLQFLSQSIRLTRKNLGPEYKQKAQTLAFYADILRVTGRKDRAKATKQRAEKARIRRKQLNRVAHTR